VHFNEAGEAEGITLKAHQAKLAHMERMHSEQLTAAKRKLDAAHNSNQSRRPYEQRDRYSGDGNGSNSYSGSGSRDNRNR
jgi:hypothetical protein